MSPHSFRGMFCFCIVVSGFINYMMKYYWQTMKSSIFCHFLIILIIILLKTIVSNQKLFCYMKKKSSTIYFSWTAEFWGYKSVCPPLLLPSIGWCHCLYLNPFLKSSPCNGSSVSCGSAQVLLIVSTVFILFLNCVFSYLLEKKFLGFKFHWYLYE